MTTAVANAGSKAMERRGGAAHITAETRNRRATAPVQLARGGQALMGIVVSPDATEATRKVAADLAKYLGRISGATFSVGPGDGRSGIVLGTAAEFPHPELAGALKIYDGFDGREAFAIRTTPGRVLLLGASELGAGNAAYRLLHEMGCRWLTPSPTWESVPRQPELKWALDITDRPEVPARSIWMHTFFGNEAQLRQYRPQHVAEYGEDVKKWSASMDFNNWGRRNNHHQSIKVNAGHNWAIVIQENRAEFDKHPEYWPLLNGKRAIGGNPLHVQPDIGNPAVRRMFVDYALNYFRKNPHADMVSVDPNDGGAYSQSEEFKALGSISDAVFGLANEVARAVQREFPGKMVGVLSYREHSDPPTFPLEPNVHVQFTGYILASRFSRDELMQQWAAKHRNMGFYDYYAPYEWSYDQLPGANASSLNYLSTRIREEVATNAVSIYGQSGNSWILLGMGHWIANRLMWNSGEDVAELKTDFLESAYGPAAATMRRFYERWNPDHKPIVTHNLIYAMLLDVQQATREAKDRADVLARLSDVKQYLRFVELDEKLRALKLSTPYEEREKAFIELFKHIYRSRFTYSTHYYLAVQNLFQQRGERSGIILVPKGAPKTLVNPALLKRGPENPWQVEQPFTPQEIEADFQSSLAYFKSPLIQEQSYSSDVVPVEFDAQQAATLPPVSTILFVQGSTMRFAIHTRGEPIRVLLKPGAINGNLLARPYILRDAAGKVLAQGEVRPSDPEERYSLTLPVPAAGNYYFDATDTGAGFLTATFPAELQVTMVQQRSSSLSEQGAFPRPIRYFYVPKGTRELQFIYQSWMSKYKVVRPDGQTAFEGEPTRGYNILPVPEGMDGKVWGFAVRFGTFWPANFPPHFAFTPRAVMVPREVALKDGLKIVQK